MIEKARRIIANNETGFNKICINCGKEYKASSNFQKLCKDCSTVKVKCAYCGKGYTIKRTKNTGGTKYCSNSCSAKARTQK